MKKTYEKKTGKGLARLLALLVAMQLVLPAYSAYGLSAGQGTPNNDAVNEQVRVAGPYEKLETTIRSAGRESEYAGYIVSVKDNLSTLQEWSVEAAVALEEGIDSLEYSEGLYVAESLEAIRDTIKEGYIEEIVPNYIRRFIDEVPSSGTGRSFASVGALNDYFSKYQYHITSMNVSAAWEQGMEGQDLDASVDLNKNGKALDDPIVISVIDSGLNMGLEDLDYSRILKGKAFRTDSRGSVYTDDDIRDYLNHGTMIVGAITAKKNNNVGVAGILQKVKILPLKVSDNEGPNGAEIPDSNVIAAMNYSILQKVSVINLSLGGYEHNPLLESVCKKAMNAGIILVCAAGNYYDIMGSTPGYPAQYSLGVGAVDDRNQVASFSQRLNPKNGSGWQNQVWVAAPGEGIYTVSYDGGYAMGQGTSYATPMVSALAALCKSVHNNITEDQFKVLLKESSTYKAGKGTVSGDYKLDAKGNKQYQSIEYGWGIVNYEKALSLIHSWGDAVITKKPTATSAGIKTYTCEICKATKTETYGLVTTDITSAKVTNINATYDYNGKNITPEPKVVLGGTTLKKNTDYTVKYDNNLREGTATVTITGKGKYAGTIVKTFRIVHKHVYENKWIKVNNTYHKKLCIYNNKHELREEHTWDKGTVTKAATRTATGIKVFRCTGCGAERSESIPKLPSAQSDRLYGENRYETGFKVADAYMAQRGLKKLDGVIVACGTNFPDALAASYLAKSKKVPIILWSEKQNLAVQNYIKKNVKSGGTIYLLGGPSIVGKNIANGMTNYKFTRIYDENRYGTNIKILKQAKLKGGEILVCVGTAFENALIGSATGKPILLVKGGGLNAEQKAYLKTLSSVSFTILGDTATITPQVESDLLAISKNVTRINEKNVQQMSVRVASKYFSSPKEIILAIDSGFPDALCGGALAIAKSCPIMLADNARYTQLAKYCGDNPKINKATVLGGPTLITDATVTKVLSGK